MLQILNDNTENLIVITDSVITYVLEDLEPVHPSREIQIISLDNSLVSLDNSSVLQPATLIETAIAQPIDFGKFDSNPLVRSLRNTQRTRIAAAKRARDRGEAYETHRGKRVPARSQRGPCQPSCRLKCSRRLGTAERQSLFKEFWSLASHTGQWDFIASNISVAPKEHNKRAQSRRAKSRVYSFALQGQRVEQVCKVMFLNTLGISQAWIDTVCKKIAKNGYVSTDGRGKVGHRRKKQALV